MQKKTKPARSTTVQVPKDAGGEVPHLNSPKAAAFIQPSEFMEGENKKKIRKVPFLLRLPSQNAQ